jgi:uncharacterized protein YecT (DUF1311 family)
LSRKIKIKPMKLPFIAVFFVLVATSALCQSTQSPCWKTATAQSEMNHCADLDAREADADLNHVYEELLSKLKSDDSATEKLRAAQRAWAAFRDAHLQELFPAQDKQREYGSMYPMCYAQMATTMAKERTAQLRRMLDDEDACETSTPARNSECDAQQSVCPQSGFVPDERTAVRIGEAVLMPIYEQKHIAREEPFTATLKGNRWIVKGTLPKPKTPNEIVMGGTAVAEIDKMDGRIVAVYHLK